MFDGIHRQDQFHQFLASSSSSSSSSRAPPAATATAAYNAAHDHLHLTFSLYGSNINNSPTTYPSSTCFDHRPPPPPPPPHHHHHHHNINPFPLPPPPPPAAAAHQHHHHHHLQQQQDQVALHAPAAIHQQHHPHLHQVHHLLHKDHHHHHYHLDEEELQVVKEESGQLQMSTGLVVQQLQAAAADVWSNEEVLALLRIRSSVDINWFPDFIWEHVSRKLGELGFNRSADKCKEKFEEENRYLNSINCSSKNYRLFGELEVLYHSDHHNHDHGHNHENQLHQHLHHQQVPAEPSPHHHDNCNRNEEIDEDDAMEDDSRRKKLVEEVCQSVGSDERIVTEPEEEESKRSSALRKRKRHRKKMKLEIFKGLCESIVNKMLAHQEELHNRILENLVKREDERIAREDAWKVQEMGRIKKEMEFRAQEQALASDRQAKIIELLNKFTSSTNTNTNITSCFHHDDHQYHNQILSQLCLDHLRDQKTADSDHIAKTPKPNTPQTPNSSSTNIAVQANQNTSSLATQSCSLNLPTTSSNDDSHASQNPRSIIPNTLNNDIPNSPHDNSPRHPKDSSTNYEESSGDYQDSVKRWPRDEVLALINIRCSLYNTNTLEPRPDSKEQGGDGEGGRSSSGTTNSSSRGPLWERISKGMLELGYKRSAKRCKEKWENINKYFRKTKDMNKKRSLDSRTCPYFHQLSYLYSTQGAIAAGSAPAPTEGLLTSPEGGWEKDQPENDQDRSARESDNHDQGSDQDRNVGLVVPATGCGFEF